MKARRAALLAAAALALVLSYRALAPRPAPDAASQAGPAPAERTPAAAPGANGAVRRVRIALAEIAGSAAALRIVARQGETIVLEVEPDGADELHLHGYDRVLALEPGRPAQLTLVADRAGRFEIELHRSHRLVAVLEVQPD